MKRRSLFFAIAIAVLVAGFGALDARAGGLTLPQSLSAFVNPDGTSNGEYTTVMGAENLTFSGFTYASSSSPPPGAAGPPAATFTLNSYTVLNETGFKMTGTLFAAANTMVDVSISYIVTAPKGELLKDALLSTTGGNFGGTGDYTINETLSNGVTLGASSSSPIDLVTFSPGVQSLEVQKDIFLLGGSKGESLSIITQAFSSTSVPEPATLALLGIGMTGLLAFRRLFKRASAA